MTELEAEFAIRPVNLADESERNLVLKLWLVDGVDSAYADAVTHRAWYSDHERMLRERVLPSSTVECVVLRDEPSAILAWCCYSGDVLHFVHVKRRWRRVGLARMLLARHAFAVYTHRTRMCSALPIPGAWQFNPYPALVAA